MNAGVEEQLSYGGSFVAFGGRVCGIFLLVFFFFLRAVVLCLLSLFYVIL